MSIFKRLPVLILCFLLCLPAALAAAEAQGVMVDFDYLTHLNPDCKGWLYQPESGLSQPVMQNETDDWYHERAFDQTKVYRTGSVYLTAEASLKDEAVLLNGQTREEGCLELLSGWREQDYLEQHASFCLLTPEGNHQAEAFACLVLQEDRPKDWLRQDQPFDEWLEAVRLHSTVFSPAAQPAEDDRLLLIAGHHLNGSFTLVMAVLSDAEAPAQSAVNLTKAVLDSTETNNGMVSAGPAGQLMYFAQNDPLYELMRYESEIRNDVHRDFGGGGCGPAAMAIIAANLVDTEALPLLGEGALHELGNLFCPCSVNRVYCDHTHVPYQLRTPEEYLRYLPVALGDFACGNNRWEYVARRPNSQGTNVRFVDYVCELFGLSLTPVSGLEAGLELMKEHTGEGFILTSALRGSPYTNSSHFVVLAGVDEEYFYVLDPFRRTEEEYLKTDERNILELLSPGVTRIRLEDFARSDLSPVCYISAKP